MRSTHCWPLRFRFSCLAFLPLSLSLLLSNPPSTAYTSSPIPPCPTALPKAPSPRGPGGNACKAVYVPELRTDSERVHEHYRRLGIPHEFRGQAFDSKIHVRAPDPVADIDSRSSPHRSQVLPWRRSASGKHPLQAQCLAPSASQFSRLPLPPNVLCQSFPLTVLPTLALFDRQCHGLHGIPRAVLQG